MVTESVICFTLWGKKAKPSLRASLIAVSLLFSLNQGTVAIGEWENGNGRMGMGEWENGGMGEWENGNGGMGEWGNGGMGEKLP